MEIETPKEKDKGWVHVQTPIESYFYKLGLKWNQRKPIKVPLPFRGRKLQEKIATLLI